MSQNERTFVKRTLPKSRNAEVWDLNNFLKKSKISENGKTFEEKKKKKKTWKLIYSPQHLLQSLWLHSKAAVNWLTVLGSKQIGQRGVLVTETGVFWESLSPDSIWYFSELSKYRVSIFSRFHLKWCKIIKASSAEQKRSSCTALSFFSIRGKMSLVVR